MAMQDVICPTWCWCWFVIALSDLGTVITLELGLELGWMVKYIYGQCALLHSKQIANHLESRIFGFEIKFRNTLSIIYN